MQRGGPLVLPLLEVAKNYAIFVQDNTIDSVMVVAKSEEYTFKELFARFGYTRLDVVNRLSYVNVGWVPYD